MQHSSFRIAEERSHNDKDYEEISEENRLQNEAKSTQNVLIMRSIMKILYSKATHFHHTFNPRTN